MVTCEFLDDLLMRMSLPTFMPSWVQVWRHKTISFLIKLVNYLKRISSLETLHLRSMVKNVVLSVMAIWNQFWRPWTYTQVMTDSHHDGLKLVIALVEGYRHTLVEHVRSMIPLMRDPISTWSCVIWQSWIRFWWVRSCNVCRCTAGCWWCKHSSWRPQSASIKRHFYPE